MGIRDRQMGGRLDFSQLRAVLLDLDGVMYRGAVLCHGAAEFVRFMRELGVRPFFLSNNSRAGADAVGSKLTSLGVPVADEEVVTAAELTVQYLAARRVKTTVSVIGSDWMAASLAAAGWQVVNGNASCLVVGLDHALTYAKLQMGVDALLGGAAFVACNFDPVNPIERTLELGCGSIVAALANATGRRAICIGKPSLRMLRTALRRLGLRADQTIVVGDSLVSDMALARRGGAHAALLLSGQTSRSMAEALPPARRPDLVLEDLAELQAVWHEALR
jgi:HAD superfamily hydrolase (TIGR01450 family)